MVVGIPVYMYFREKMTGDGFLNYLANYIPRLSQKAQQLKEQRRDVYGRRRIFKLTGVNLGMNTLISMYALLLLTQIYPSYSSTSLILFVLFGFTICLTFYGMGIYITAIVIEAYTKIDLHKTYAFKFELLGEHLFHGAISHLFICSGWIGVFVVLAIIDSVSGRQQTISLMLPLILLAGLAGVISALGQIVNKTAFFQLVVSSVLLFVLCGALVLVPTQFEMHPMVVFVLSALICFNTTLAVYIMKTIFLSKIKISIN